MEKSQVVKDYYDITKDGSNSYSAVCMGTLTDNFRTEADALKWCINKFFDFVVIPNDELQQSNSDGATGYEDLLAIQLYDKTIKRFRKSNNETERRYLDEARLHIEIASEAFKNAERFSK